MRNRLPLLLAALLLNAAAHAQQRPSIGARAGLAYWDRSTGVLFGAAGELPVDRALAVGLALDLSSGSGSPVEWTTTLRYRFTPLADGWDPYAAGGVALLFRSGGPFFGLKLGGGATMPISRHVRAGVDVTAGPTFAPSTAFSFSAAAVLLYVLP
jgi:hypothetical protein